MIAPQPTQQTIRELCAAMPFSPAHIERIRKQFGTSLADECLTSALLQVKARRKLGDGVWWVSEKSLEQATAWQVARLKAIWLGGGLVYDLCCGIAGDSLQFARRAQGQDEIIAVDIDPAMVRFAQSNLNSISARMHPSVSVKVLQADVTRISLPNGAAVHIDPDRRASAQARERSRSRRTTRPEDYQPPLDETMRLLERAQSAVIKLAPAAQLPESISRLAHRCWISLSGSVREQTVLLGSAMERAGQHAMGVSAVAIDYEGNAQTFSAPAHDRSTQDCQNIDSAAEPSEMMVDPDAAIRASGLTESFALHHGLKTLGGPAGFLTGSGCNEFPQSIPMAIVGRVVYRGSCDHRKLRRELRSRNYSVRTVKVRGSDHDPAALTRQLRGCGEIPVTLWIGRTGKRAYAAITEHSPVHTLPTAAAKPCDR